MERICRSVFFTFKRAAFFLIFCFAAVLILCPGAVFAGNRGKTVRIGWYESPFNTLDSFGRRSGYAYEYQMKVAAYSGWEYEYVNGSWTELLEMLKDGRIDILSDVSYTEERTRDMLFSELPMGTEEYIIFITPLNKEITSEDYSTLNGKRIGINKGSIQEGLFLKWAEKNNVRPKLIELTGNELESQDMLDSGKLDAFVTINAYGDPKKLVPVCKIGSSDFFFAVNKDRKDLLDELNNALNRIQDENPYYNERMFEKYIRRFGSNAFLTDSEADWLSSHDAIRVGYQDDYLAFCASDPSTGELTGALKDYLEAASVCITDTKLDFKTQPFNTAAAALDALEKGEVDCVFPANISSYDGESLELVMTPALMRTDVYAMVRQDNREFFSGKEHVIVAVNEGNPNYEVFLKDNYPDWRIVYFPDTSECLKAVSKGLADCVLISSFRYYNILRLCERYKLTAFSTGKELDYCFAVRGGETDLYSILAKVTGLIPYSTVNASLSHYITEDARPTLYDFIVDNLAAVVAVTAIVLLLILILMIRSIRSERKARMLIEATEKDELTGIYNRNYFFQYAERMYREGRDTARDAIVMNIEKFHSINALNGRSFGDRVLRTLGKEIAAYTEENGGIAGHLEADHFDIFCPHRDDHTELFERLQKKLTALSPYTSIRLRMGVMPWEQGLEPVQQFDMARTACSMARGHFKEHLIVFDDKVREKELYDEQLQSDMRRALDDFEFEVYYQPKYGIQCDEPVLRSAEALIRWRHPEYGMIAPDQFIPVFERNGKIGDVDRFVWSQAAAQIAHWKAQFGITLPISVNLSRVDVFDPKLGETLDTILSENGLDHRALMLEVTESAYTENADQIIRVVENLRSKGFMVEMDDFGTGYSSLNMLSSMPVDVLKMDRHFIRNVENSEKDVQLVDLIIKIASRLNITVVAEGVETEEQLLLLKDLGCELVQGYYFSRPLHPKDFESQIMSGIKLPDY